MSSFPAVLSQHYLWNLWICPVPNFKAKNFQVHILLVEHCLNKIMHLTRLIKWEWNRMLYYCIGIIQSCRCQCIQFNIFWDIVTDRSKVVLKSFLYLILLHMFVFVFLYINVNFISIMSWFVYKGSVSCWEKLSYENKQSCLRRKAHIHYRRQTYDNDTELAPSAISQAVACSQLQQTPFILCF